MRNFFYAMRLLIQGTVLICFITVNGFSQSNDVTKRFELYNQHALTEKLYVHIDKPFYLAGEIAWLKIYAVDGTRHMPLNMSKVAYVELLDKDQHPVLQTKLYLQNGTGKGSLFLPATINSGNYELRAYTSYMKNFGSAYFFHTSLTIVNAQKNAGLQASYTIPRADIQFFPEGGNLVNGIESTVGFRVVDKTGHGIPFEGFLLDDQKDTVAKFQPLRFGIGRFSFTPQSGKNYTATIVQRGETIGTVQMPHGFNEGIVMKLSRIGKGKIEVSVISNLKIEQSFVHLLAHNGQTIQYAGSEGIRSGKAVFKFDESVLHEGITHFTLFTEEGVPVCERLFFKRPAQKMFINAATDRSTYETRKKVDLTFDAKDKSGNPEMPEMSLSVYLLDSLSVNRQDDIFSYLYLASDLAGTVEMPGYYVHTDSEESDEAADNLMLTQGWSRFKWEDIIRNPVPVFKYLPEYDGLLIPGKLVDRKSGKSIENVNASISVPGKSFEFANATSNSKGEVLFNSTHFFGSTEIIAETGSLQDSMYRIDVSSPFVVSEANPVSSHLVLQPGLLAALETRSIGVQAENAYHNNQLQQFKLPVVSGDTTMFYGTPDRKYFLDDYTRFQTMEEVIREYVADVTIRKPQGNYHLRVMHDPYRLFFEEDPLILLDGVAVNNAEKIIAMDPLKIKKIEVMARKYFYGQVQYSGIVSFFTYNGDLAGYQLDPNALIMEYEGLQLHREFYSPVYETAEQAGSRVPDFRNQLYWSGDIQPDATGTKKISFYTSDLKGKYLLVLQGLSPNGHAATKEINFDVK